MQQKGVAIRSTLRALEGLHGPDVARELVGRLPADARAQIQAGIVPVAWYPVAIAASIHVAIRDMLGKGHWEESRKIGRAAADIDFHGIYRVLLRSVQYDSVWDRIERAWASYNTQGTFRWLERRPGLMNALVSGVSGFNPGMWLGAMGRAERLIELAGAKACHGTIVEPTSTSSRFEVMWLE